MKTEMDMWNIFKRMPKKVHVGDITIRDGFQHEEKFVSTRAKIYYAEEMIFAGCRHIEVTNLGSSFLMPQFSDAEEILAYFKGEVFKKKCEKRGINLKDIFPTPYTCEDAEKWIKFTLSLPVNTNFAIVINGN